MNFPERIKELEERQFDTLARQCELLYDALKAFDRGVRPELRVSKEIFRALVHIAKPYAMTFPFTGSPFVDGVELRGVLIRPKLEDHMGKYPDTKKSSAAANPNLAHENTKPPGAEKGPVSSGRRVHTSKDG